ncbi:HlyD family type I secretion periplasmic adaptor subunit [Roseibium sp. Sym1]|uniref:HlyD family type I secretion periplasmic adaptor subunit n=1 Tax=Roseibium sp. Sym1 TaxID=3016006 RepID=UPI003FA6E548
MSTCALLVFGFGGWAVSAKLSGAVVTQGKVVVATDLKAVQHPDGGIVADIRVQNGDRVQAGDVVLTLDDKLLKANRVLVDDQLVALEARLARLHAERQGLDNLAPSRELDSRPGETKVADATASQQAVMETRRTSLEGQVAAYEEQITQYQQEISGLETQRASANEQIDFIEHELKGLEVLFEKGLTPETRITALKRERSGLNGSVGSLTSQIAVTRGKISETRLAILQLEKSFQEQVTNEISAIVPEIAQLKERRATSDLMLSRVDVRAPADGFVHELAIHTVGGVIQPGETLMRIVPEADKLVVSAAVMPQDINKVAKGNPASLVIGAFDQKVVPRLEGTVSFLSADLKMDQATGMSFYEVRVDLDDSAADLLSGRDLTLQPGMPSEVFIQTGERTMAEYLLDPLTKQLRKTFRET